MKCHYDSSYKVYKIKIKDELLYLYRYSNLCVSGSQNINIKLLQILSQNYEKQHSL